MEVHYITWDIDDHRRWVVTCPSLSKANQEERSQWCLSRGMDFINLGVRFWFAEHQDVMLFTLRWE